ncbi:hypothetical protein AYK26_06600 [Euryarchaeota archaeon SM23-78]|nr:MAG: hypothetical protein AYK26_06600 [Euryarchaeota archaeon SM23-78]MBW3000934.1 hypothetical protein [Candidatus Woesearchaeota archaeon]
MVYWLDFVYSPPWFYGKDIVIDIISAIVVLIIGIFAFRNFLLDKKNYRHLLFSAAFVILGGSFIVKILTNILSHHIIGISKYLTGLLIPNIIPKYSLLPALGFLIHAGMTLFGFYILYTLTSEHKIISTDYLMIAYFIVISTYFARFNYFLFYITALIFLVTITRRYFLSYKKSKYKNTFFLGVSFCVIGLSQFVFIFTSSNHTLYVLAEIIQLIGYLFLLYTFVMVLRNAKKKK